MIVEDIPDSHPDYRKIIDALNAGKCPDCDNRAIEPGPRGGLSRNCSCWMCGSRFNVAPWYPDDRPLNFFFVQRLSSATVVGDPPSE
jgi:hypothetical protein